MTLRIDGGHSASAFAHRFRFTYQTAASLCYPRHPEVRALARLEGRRPACGRFILRGSLRSHLRMTDTTPRSRGIVSPELCKFLVLTLEVEGAGKAGCRLHPRSRVLKCTLWTHTSIQVQPKQPGLPRAMALRLTSCSPRWAGFFATVTLRKTSRKA